MIFELGETPLIDGDVFLERAAGFLVLLQPFLAASTACLVSSSWRRRRRGAADARRFALASAMVDLELLELDEALKIWGHYAMVTSRSLFAFSHRLHLELTHATV